MEAALWFVRQGPNEELRYSIRSFTTQFPDVPVFIVGDKPAWVRNVTFTQGNPHSEKPLNVWANLTLASQWDELPENIVIMMDDIYLMEPIAEIPMLYRGPLKTHLESLKHRQDWWSNSLKATAVALANAGISDPLSYELHTPFPCRKSLLAEALDRDPGTCPPQWRTLYGNLHRVPATLHPDVKINTHNRKNQTGAFISTSDQSFRLIKHVLANKFPNPSPHE